MGVTGKAVMVDMDLALISVIMLIPTQTIFLVVVVEAEEIFGLAQQQAVCWAIYLVGRVVVITTMEAIIEDIIQGTIRDTIEAIVTGLPSVHIQETHQIAIDRQQRQDQPPDQHLVLQLVLGEQEGDEI